MSIPSRPLVAVVLAVSAGCASMEWRTGTDDLGMNSTSASLERITAERPDSVRLVMGRDFARVLHRPAVEGDSLLRGYRSSAADTVLTYRVRDVDAIQFPELQSGGEKTKVIIAGGLLVGFLAWMSTWEFF